tara:strand:- start:677 stop:958 length:282 start_codon:yes stop_codon:yes gene_type:complete
MQTCTISFTFHLSSLRILVGIFITFKDVPFKVTSMDSLLFIISPYLNFSFILSIIAITNNINPNIIIISTKKYIIGNSIFDDIHSPIFISSFY